MSKKSSEFVRLTSLASADDLTGLDNSQADPSLQNVKVSFIEALSDYPTQSDLSSHTQDADPHLTPTQNAALDGANSPSGANPLSTANDLAAHSGGLDGAISHVSPTDRSTWNGKANGDHVHAYLESVVGGSGVTIDATDPQNPVISSTAVVATDLDNTPTLTQVTIESSSGTDTIVLAASAGVRAGVMTAFQAGLLDSALQIGEPIPWSDLTGVPATFPPSAHNHDDLYYTEAEVDTLISGFITGADVTFETLDANGDVGSGAAQVAVGNHTHAYWGEGSTITDWGLTEAPEGGSGAAFTWDLDDGHVCEITMTQDATITISSTAGHANLEAKLILNTAGFTPTFAWASMSLMQPSGGFDWSTGGTYMVSLTKIGTRVMLAEQLMVALAQLRTPTPNSLTSGPAPGVLPLNKWPKAPLQHLLDSLNITYPANATVADLVALVPESHQHHIAEEIPIPSWDTARIVQWLEKEGVDIPDALKDDKDNLMEMVHDVIELKAGIPLDPGFVAPLPKDQWPTPPNLDRTSHNQLAAWMAVSLYPIADAHSVRPLLEARTKAELIAMLDGTRPLPDTSHLPADDPLPPLDESM